MNQYNLLKFVNVKYIKKKISKTKKNYWNYKLKINKWLNRLIQAKMKINWNYMNNNKKLIN
jgi:hypothetical protein